MKRRWQTETGVLMRLPARTEVRFYAAESGWARRCTMR